MLGSMPLSASNWKKKKSDLPDQPKDAFQSSAKHNRSYKPGVQGINIFLSGFVPTENLRFRDEALTFKVAETGDETEVGAKKFSRFQYPAMSKTQVCLGSVYLSQVLVTAQMFGTCQNSAWWLI